MENNILVIDNADSIQYARHELTNESLYKVTADELLDFFKDEPSYIFACDTVNCVTMILDNGSEVSLHKCSKNINAVFLKIIIDDINDILIYCPKNHYISKSKEQFANEACLTRAGLPNPKPYTKTDILKFAKLDIDGYANYQNTIAILHQHYNLSNITLPAMRYCGNKSVTVNDIVYQGYLPAAGQMLIIEKYIQLINYVFETIGLEEIPWNDYEWWTSTEYNEYCAYSYYHNRPVYTESKTNVHKLFPIFKRIVN